MCATLKYGYGVGRDGSHEKRCRGGTGVPSLALAAQSTLRGRFVFGKGDDVSDVLSCGGAFSVCNILNDTLF
ncbi:hypothetical protein KDAU_24140 [Dictyobacter aurantiacus]|uniref:Uncharacterized protein n=1 Tax=Dictyobacter aurantiacus TaxID=1936993 RepID=A0A401ZE04_9CHLR|nr:hypothetical protein KDAU_24140 [Dictyobacter aurantiacus]